VIFAALYTTKTTTYIGYDSTGVSIDLKAERIVNQSLYITQSSTQLAEVKVTAKKEEARSDVRVSSIKVTPKEIKSIPGTGGQADLAQYLQVLPGVIFTGDQGGQLYIRGGSPIQNKILLDGMTIYNPFHSIGFFSVPPQSLTLPRVMAIKNALADSSVPIHFKRMSFLKVHFSDWTKKPERVLLLLLRANILI